MNLSEAPESILHIPGLSLVDRDDASVLPAAPVAATPTAPPAHHRRRESHNLQQISQLINLLYSRSQLDHPVLGTRQLFECLSTTVPLSTLVAQSICGRHTQD